MKTFEYRGYDQAGRSKSGLIEAEDAKSARERLAERGVLAERVAPAGPTSSRRRRLGPAGRATLYRELGASVAAGLPLMSALGMIVDSPDSGPAAPTLAAVRDRVREGASLADAMETGLGGGLPAHEKAILEAGERTASLGIALERLAAYLEDHLAMREKTVTALIYPALVVTLAAVIAAGLLGFAAPRVGAMFAEQTNMRLPALTRAMIWAGRLLAVAGPPLAALIAIAGALCHRRLNRDPDLARKWDAKLLGAPVLGRGYSMAAALRFTRALALLLEGGVPLVEALPLSGRASGSPWLAWQVNGCAEAVRHGESLAATLRRIPPLDAALSGWVMLGEATGSLGRALEGAAARLQQKWERYVARMLVLIEPALILAAGAFVFVIVLAIVLPIAALNRQLL